MQTKDLLATVGDATAAKIDFLRAGSRVGPETGKTRPVGVNRMHCRPLHPHGKRLVDEGLMRLVRSGTKKSQHTALVITEAGRAELVRLEKRLARRARKDAGQRALGGYVQPRGKSGSSFPAVQPSGQERRRRRAEAIAFSKRAAQATT